MNMMIINMLVPRSSCPKVFELRIVLGQKRLGTLGLEKNDVVLVLCFLELRLSSFNF